MKVGGLLSQVVREITVEALPIVDAGPFRGRRLRPEIGEVFASRRSPSRKGRRSFDDDETVVASVLAPRRVELPEDLVEEEEVEGEEGERSKAKRRVAPADEAEPEPSD